MVPSFWKCKTVDRLPDGMPAILTRRSTKVGQKKLPDDRRHPKWISIWDGTKLPMSK